MADIPRITLRYFDARGRAQFLRYYFRHRGIAFEDDRVPMSADFREWLAIRDDQAVSGPFRKLPVLHWEGRMIAEGLAIRSFVHHASGDAANLSEEDNYRDEMLASSVYHDLMRTTRTLLWADLIFPGLDLAAFTRRTTENLPSYLAVLDKTVRDWSMLEGTSSQPLLLTDCLLWEELDVVQRIFGDHLPLDETESLARFYRECPGRTSFELLLREQPCQMSGRPGEAAAVTKLREILTPI